MMLSFLLCALVFVAKSSYGIKCYQCFEIAGQPGCHGYDIIDNKLDIYSIRLNGKDWYVADCDKEVEGPIQACTRPHIHGKFRDGTIKDVTNHACGTRMLNRFLGFPDNHTVDYNGCASIPIKNQRSLSTTIFSTCFCTRDLCNKQPYCKVDEKQVDSCALPYMPKLNYEIAHKVLDLEKLTRMV